MKQPSIFVRTAGSSVVAASLIACGAWLIIAWTQGRATGWAALMGLFVLGKAISSARQMKLYKAWRKEWNSVGTFGKEPAKRKMRPLRMLTFTAAGLFIGVLGCWPQTAGRPHLQDLLVWVWLCCGLFLLARPIVSVGRLISKRRHRLGKSDAAPVSWMLGGASDSPSREAAKRRLPEYAARVLNHQP